MWAPLEASMRYQQYSIRVICAVIALSFTAPSLAMAQSALDKFGEGAFGAQNVEKYAAELSNIGEKLRERETETQQASRRVLTFLNLLRRAKSEQEWSILSLLRPDLNTRWKYLIETGSVTGQQFQATSFGNDLPTIYEQSKKVLTDPQAAAEFILGEALVVGPYGRSAGELFRVWQPDRKIASNDLARLVNASKSGIIEKVEKTENKELLPISDPIFDCTVGLGTILGDLLAAAAKGTALKTRVISILSVPGGLSQVLECNQKLSG
jgi:hypothetical protein